MAVREEQIMLCHEMLDNLLGRNIALCDAGVGIGKTYAYLVACVLMRKYSLLAEGCSPYEQRPVVISTSSIALQKAILTEYIPFLSRILQENGTFHGTVFSIKYQIPFATLIRPSNIEKLSDLLEKFGLSSRTVNDANNIKDVCTEEIDKLNILKLLKTYRESAITYLKDNL